MEFESQLILSNMVYNRPAKKNRFSVSDYWRKLKMRRREGEAGGGACKFLCKDKKCSLAAYMSILRSATSNNALPDEKRRMLLDLCESEALLREPENITTTHQDELKFLHNIGDGDIALHSIETAVQALDKGQQAQAFLQLSRNAFSEHMEEAAGLERVIALMSKAVAFTPLNNPNRPVLLNMLGYFYRLRFDQFGEVKDIDLAIKRQLEGLTSTPLDSDVRSGFLGDLGNSLTYRFQRFGEVEDIDSAIERHCEAVASAQLDSIGLSRRLHDLGMSHIYRFERFGEAKDIDSAIKRHSEAVASTPLDSDELSGRLSNLGNSYLRRFEWFGEAKNIESAIERHREAVVSTPLGSADLPGRLKNLGNTLQSRFERFGEVEDIDSAIQQHREAVVSTPLNSADLPGRLNSLGNSHLRRFERVGDIKDMELAIERHREAVASTPLDSPERPGRLNNLGISYMYRFERLDEVKDIESAIERQHEAVASTPPDSANLPKHLHSLGRSHLCRFERFGDIKDVESAIKRHREAVASTPLNSCNLPKRLDSMGLAHLRRFERFGEIKDLDSAIEQYREAVASTPLNSPDRPGQLTNLGISHMSRFERFGEVKDIDSAIERQCEAVASTPLDSTDLPKHLDSMGNSHRHRFQRFGETKDIDSAIERQRDAVASTPLDSTDLPGLLGNLGISHLHRFARFGEVKDFDSGTRHLREAVASTPLDSAGLPVQLSNLGNSHLQRFEWFGEVKDIDLAIKQLREAVASTPLDSADRPSRLNNLANSYQRRFESTQEFTDLEKAVSHFRLSSISQNGLPSSRIRGSLKWASITHALHDLESASEAYEQAIRLLPQVAWIGLSAVAQLNTLNSDIQALGCDAAACMIALTKPGSHDEQRHLGRAIELLDQGRSVLWSQTSNFKRDLDDLREVDSQLACELDLVGKTLGQSCFRDSNDTLSEADAQSYRRSAEKWEELIRRVRDLPGFNHFLLPPPISRLQTTAANGPVVIINCSQYRYDAIIIHPQGSLVLVPLTSITAEEVNMLTNQQEAFASRQSRIGTLLDDNNEPPVTLENLLNQTWLFVGEPIFQKLKELGLVGSTPTPCRVWWCLTGSLSFLPIHASFPPNEPSMGMIDHVVSSYTPTISALLRAQQQRKKLSTFQMLAVGQSNALGMMPLPGVAKEIAFISKELGADAKTLEECKATVDGVAASLPTCSWAHFACHGVQDPDKPMDSGLVLWDGYRLTISRLAQSLLASAEFAFLSCCQSAKGSKQFPNEAVHLAASLQFIGFRGVIGTMWSVGDNDALSIAKHVYGELFKNGTAKASPSDAALALHKAVCHLRDHDHVPLVRWVPFVHFGF